LHANSPEPDRSRIITELSLRNRAVECEFLPDIAITATAFYIGAANKKPVSLTFSSATGQLKVRAAVHSVAQTQAENAAITA
jgi:hypothetical protein